MKSKTTMPFMRHLALILLLVSCSKKEAPVEAKRQPLPSASSAAASPAASASASASPRPCPEEMTSIAAGTFELDGAGAEVRVEGFCIDTTEVTLDAYAACATCTRPDKLAAACNSDAKKRGDHPVNCVTWSQADAYCKAKQKRLPTEEEWEYAASGSDERTYPWGNAAPSTQLCWHRQDREGTCPVGSHESGRSPFGVEDLAGNVREWTASAYDEKKKSDEPARPGVRVVRGSGWTQQKPVRNGIRAGVDPAEHAADLGFRCAR